MEEKEQLELLLKQSKRRTVMAGITMGAALVICLSLVISLIILVPKAVRVTDNLNKMIESIDSAVSDMHTLAQALEDTSGQLSDFVSDNSLALTETIEKIKDVNFEDLNKAITGLKDAVTPFANFVNMFH